MNEIFALIGFLAVCAAALAAVVAIIWFLAGLHESRNYHAGMLTNIWHQLEDCQKEIKKLKEKQ